mgnify:CR=1 FL=1
MAISSSSTPRTAQMVEANRRLEEIHNLTQDKQKEEQVSKEKVKLERKLGNQWRLNLKLLFGILLLIALATAIVRALAQGDGLLWLLSIPELPEEVGEIATILAPLLAVAVAIERLLETAFDWYEQSIRAVSDVVSSARQPLDWIEEELKQAYDAAKKAAEATGIKADEPSLKALEKAEQRLAEAEKRLLSWVKAPEYVAWKRAISIWVGLLVGLEVAVLSDLGMLHMIGIPAPRLLDMLATGLVIGAGPGPMHSIIGMIQGGKDAIEKLGDLAEGKAIREAAEALKSKP